MGILSYIALFFSKFCIFKFKVSCFVVLVSLIKYFILYGTPFTIVFPPFFYIGHCCGRELITN